MSSKYREFFEASRKHQSADLDRSQPERFKDNYVLPGELKRKEEVAREFRDYIEHREETGERGYIHPPFEASKVPSPYHGFNKPKKKKVKKTDYSKLKKDLRKNADEFLLFDVCVTEDLEAAWLEREGNLIQSSSPSKHEEQSKKTRKTKAKVLEKVRRTNGLHRTLSTIMDDDRSGENQKKMNVPGLFENKAKH
ncbi:hypothetical protein ADIAL_1757 [Alkalibacterium sp. AK22]|uniref:hypothetical protein n=1 Tax=Alkalibacterium sp. AK22 TaxID=1229520 RepID=UPI00045104CC|nr:hypothetical protein [Alkalibacterium sp. AK22]EXJ22906.1 hypothetical protein ADIAL_1757 [Alkalibacterium sp. AK22]